MTCDGCEGRFDPGLITYRRAGIVKQVVGGIVVALGIVARAPPLLAMIALFGKTKGDIMFRFGGQLIIAAFLVVGGLSLTRGRMVYQGTAAEPTTAAGAPDDCPPGIG